MLNNKTTITKLRSQRGAMFGLDARVALAIFAGLSVVAGMAVFGTIRQTDVTALVSELDNVGKGYVNYAFDTGIDVPVGAGVGQGFRGLFQDTAGGVVGWNGPYITRSSAEHPRFGTYDIVQGRMDAASPATGIPAAAVAGQMQGSWASLTLVPCEIAQNLDEEIDGDTDPVTAGVQLLPLDGNLRHANPCAAGATTTIHYLLSRTMTQP